MPDVLNYLSMEKVGETVMSYVMNDMAWKVDLPAFLKEAHDGAKNSPYAVTFNCVLRLLTVLAERAREINDPALNIIMLNLSLFEGSHDHPFYHEAVSKMRERIKEEIV